MLPDATEDFVLTARSRSDMGRHLRAMAEVVGVAVVAVDVELRWFRLRERVTVTVSGQPEAIRRYDAADQTFRDGGSNGSWWDVIFFW